MERLILKPGRERSVLRRHPWVFSGAIAKPPSEAAASGDTVEVAASDGTVLGYGSWSPASQIRARMLTFGQGAEPSEALVRERVFLSVARRGSYFADGRTDAVRLVNAESDALPGVVADFYAGWAVCQFTSAGAERWKQTVAAALMESAPGCLGVAERADAESRAKEGLEKGGFRVLAGAEPPELVKIHEGEVEFLVDVRRGHKTGFYLDQREARAAAGPFANGGDVLNCFSYSGGFGLFARACGAASVTQVDASADALALARKNEELQHLCGTKMEYVEADVFKYLRSCRDANRSFDMIVLDPPKFADTKGQVMRAARGYKDINLLAMKLLRPGGTLATFSCSGAITEELFGKILAEAAADARRDFQTVMLTRQAADHPVALSFPEGLYLKGAILRAM